MFTGILGGSAIALALSVVILAIKLISSERAFADKLAKTYDQATKDIGNAKAETSTALAAQHVAEMAMEKYRQAADGAILSIESARMELATAKRTNGELVKRIADLQEALDHADTPTNVRDRLVLLLRGSPKT